MASSRRVLGHSLRAARTALATFSPLAARRRGRGASSSWRNWVDGFLQEGEAFCASGDVEMLDGVSLVRQGEEFCAQVVGGVGREEEEASPGGLSGEEGSSPGVVDFQGGFLPVVGMA